MSSRRDLENEIQRLKNELISTRIERGKWHQMALASKDGEGSNDVNGQMTIRTQFYRELLFRIVQGCYEISWADDLDDEWELGYILDELTRSGVLAVCRLPGYGASIWGCGLAGLAPPYRPERAVIANQWIESYEPIIGKDCEIIYLNPFPHIFNYNEIVDIYAEKLASCDAGIDVNIFNSKMAYAFFPESQKQASIWKRVLNKISNGCPAIFVKENPMINGSDFKANLVFNNLKQNYIAAELQESKRLILNEFYTLLSINNVATEKKERLVSGEVDVNNTELLANTETIAKYLKICTDRVNKMFPECQLKIEYKWRGDLERAVKYATDAMQLQRTVPGNDGQGTAGRNSDG